ncbi:MAG: aminotransferase class I/II-fold pyridoxal phosphate-dependent enzyme [Candidatus Eremiobacteraeota bacterium]|nr:aminotransferase class I/II-fold pyridoxal phosphate-dependent enzyme [Candidatus Eremiobacteraeota bacterium]
MLAPFKLERYFARYEFTTRYLLCASDAEAMPIRDLLALEPGAAERFDDVWLGYTESRGSPELREAIATLYPLTGADGVLVHAGTQEAIFTLLSVLAGTGDHVIAQFPAYQSQYAVVEASGAEVSRWHSDLTRDGAPDPDDLERLVRPSTRALIVTSPNNPTGFVFERERLDRTIEFARKHGLWLVSDEVYRGSEHDPLWRLPPVCDLYERGISLGGTAKSYGLAGLRIGWTVTGDAQLYERLASFKDYLTICNSAPSEFLATVGMRHGDELIERVQRIVTRNLDLLDAYFARHTGTWQWRRPRAGTTAFPRYVRGDTDRLCAELIENAGVLLLPSSVFDCGNDRVRIGYGRANLPDALAVMERYIDDL